MNLVETFMDGEQKISVKLISMKKQKKESLIVEELREKLNSTILQNEQECKYVCFLCLSQENFYFGLLREFPIILISVQVTLMPVMICSKFHFIYLCILGI